MCKMRRRASDFVSRLFKTQNNHRHHKDPGYCTNQNLLCRGSQKTEVDPAGNIEIIKSQHRGVRIIKREIKTRRKKSEHCRHLAIIGVLQHRPKTTLNQARLDNIRHLANLMKNEMINTKIRTETASTRRRSTTSSRHSGVATIFGPPANYLFGPLAKRLRRLLLSGGPLAGPFSLAGPPRSRGLRGPRYATVQTLIVVLSGDKPREEVIEQIKQLCNHLTEDFEQNEENNENGC